MFFIDVNSTHILTYFLLLLFLRLLLFLLFLFIFCGSPKDTGTARSIRMLLLQDFIPTIMYRLNITSFKLLSCSNSIAIGILLSLFENDSIFCSSPRDTGTARSIRMLLLQDFIPTIMYRLNITSFKLLSCSNSIAIGILLSLFENDIILTD